MKLQVGMMAPEFSGKTLEGHQISLESLRGKNFGFEVLPLCDLPGM